MLAKIKDSAVPTLVIVAALMYFGWVAAGPKAPEMLKPKS